MKIENIIFDVDGTLWDTTEVVSQAWNEVLLEKGISVTSNLLKSQFGKMMTEIADNIFCNIEPEHRMELMEMCCASQAKLLEKCEQDMLYPKVKETIKTLSKKFKIFIVSNCQAGYIELFLKKSDLSEFVTDIECFGNTKKCKADNIKSIINRNNLKNAVYVGDTQGDCEAAKNAGVPFIFAEYGFGDADSYILSISSMEELLKW